MNPLLIIIPFVVVPAIMAMIITLAEYCISPFKYPYFKCRFDVTGTKLPKPEDYVDQYLINHKMQTINQHMAKIEAWEADCKRKIEKSIFKKKRVEQFVQYLNPNKAFVFVLTRNKTRYRQSNYVKYHYTVIDTVVEFGCSFEYLKERFDKLEAINFEAPLSTYNSKKQRSLMTRELREQIAQRDNYTCQICGKYMPDGVGLHIDHIIPISKGGKSIPSNLQVLCSKCNGKKSAKQIDECL